MASWTIQTPTTSPHLNVDPRGGQAERGCTDGIRDEARADTERPTVGTNHGERTRRGQLHDRPRYLRGRRSHPRRGHRTLTVEVETGRKDAGFLEKRVAEEGSGDESREGRGDDDMAKNWRLRFGGGFWRVTGERVDRPVYGHNSYVLMCTF